jgi:SPP1 gp7 family putative phage head morphogenesis protein
MKIQENKVAASYLRGKATMTPGAFGKLPDQLKARAFTAARLDDLAQLRRIQELVAEIPEGGDWRKIRNEIAAEIGDVEGAKARAQLIMRVNAMEAYAVGRYASAVEMSDAFPFWMYVTMDDGKERAEHKALNGKVLPFDDPFWDTHYPPWDWGCRCMVIKMTASQAQEKGIADSKALPGPSQNGFTFSPKGLEVDVLSMEKEYTREQAADIQAAFKGTTVEIGGKQRSLWELNGNQERV